MQCGETNVVRYVSYFEGENLPSESVCPNCHKTYDVHQLLTNQVCLLELTQSLARI